MASLFGRDGRITQIGEHIPLINNGIQQLHARAGNDEALHRARHANPIGAHGSITKVAESIPGVNKIVQVAHSVAGQPEALQRSQGQPETPPEAQSSDVFVCDSEQTAENMHCRDSEHTNIHIADAQSHDHVSRRSCPTEASNVFGRDGLLTRVGEHIPVVNNGIQQLHFRAGNDEALHRARQTNPIGAHGIITKAAEYVPVVNNIVQRAHVAADQPEALSRARDNDPIGANGSVTQVAERIPVVSSFVQVLHEHSGQEAALRRAQELNSFAWPAAVHPAPLFEMRCNSDSGFSFDERVLENGTQCWTDLEHAVCIDVPDEFLGATVFVGPYNGAPSGCLTLSIGAPARVFIFAKAGEQDGGVASLGWRALSAEVRLRVTLTEETTLSAWCRDYIAFEEMCSVQIPVVKPWVGFVAIRMLPDQPAGCEDCAGARLGLSEMPTLDAEETVEYMNKPYYDMIHGSMAEALERDALEQASEGREAIFQRWLRQFHGERDDAWYGRNYIRVDNAFRPHWEQILEHQGRKGQRDQKDEQDQQLHLYHGDSAALLCIGTEPDQAHTTGASSPGVDHRSEFVEVSMSALHHSDDSGDLSRDWQVC